MSKIISKTVKKHLTLSGLFFLLVSYGFKTIGILDEEIHRAAHDSLGFTLTLINGFITRVLPKFNYWVESWVYFIFMF